MAEDGPSQSLILASVPDADVPEERVATKTAVRQRARRRDRFLKGPIPLKWIRENIQCATDRLLLVLRAHADMQRSNEVRVRADILRDAGITDRKTGYRALNRLEAVGALTVIRKRGQRPVVCLSGLAGGYGACPGRDRT